MAAGLALSACAGRDPHPVAVIQPQDQYSDCAMIRAEIDANNEQAKKLADENGMKVAQNVTAGVVGIVVWPVWFAMDAKGAAGTEADALKSRQEFLAKLAEQRCARVIVRLCRNNLMCRLQLRLLASSLVEGESKWPCGNDFIGPARRGTKSM
jgi:hypothetical protein